TGWGDIAGRLMLVSRKSLRRPSLHVGFRNDLQYFASEYCTSFVRRSPSVHSHSSAYPSTTCGSLISSLTFLRFPRFGSRFTPASNSAITSGTTIANTPDKEIEQGRVA